jgi:phosphatidylglycerol:prolipoprotein diacylglycerol transferase
VGAKALLVIVEWPTYVTSWSGFFNLARAGGVFYGGLLGAIVATVVLLARRRISFWTFADAAAPSVALGQAFGRVGCFLAGCCWGRECTLPWAVTFSSPVAHENVGVPLGVALHPTQVYEVLGTLLLCGLLICFERRAFSGETFARYVFGYALLRGTIEFFRGDPRGEVLGVMSTSQFIAACGALAGLAIYALRRRIPPVPKPA